jgi:predicted aspartyl protease
MNVLTFDYNPTYSPSAPFVEVEVNNYDAKATPIIVKAQVDSGADATMLPISILERVGAHFEATHHAYDFSGRVHTVDLYSAAVNLVGQTFYLRVIAQENTNEGIIGRDILNNLTVTLNGPASVTEIVVE